MTQQRVGEVLYDLPVAVVPAAKEDETWSLRARQIIAKRTLRFFWESDRRYADAKRAPPDPIDAIKVRMEQRAVSRRELEAMLGGRNRVSEVLNRKRPLTIDMIRRLHRGLDIPAESLIKPTVRSTRRRARRTVA